MRDLSLCREHYRFGGTIHHGHEVQLERSSRAMAAVGMSVLADCYNG